MPGPQSSLICMPRRELAARSARRICALDAAGRTAHLAFLGNLSSLELQVVAHSVPTGASFQFRAAREPASSPAEIECRIIQQISM